VDLGRLRDGRPVALILSVLPGSEAVNPPLFVRTGGGSESPQDGERVQVLESTEYRYELTLPEAGTLLIEPAELFHRDTASGRTGRFRPGLSTGRLPIQVWLDGWLVGRAAVEVRAKKLEYLSQYRWMLRDIAAISSEIVLERFGPSEQRLAIEGIQDAQTLYQRFAFLQSLFYDEEFAGSLRQVVERPYVQWQPVEERRSVREGVRMSSRNIRELLAPGPRFAVEGLRLPSMPERITSWLHEETLDNVPNRFVKFALQRWRALCAQVRDALLLESESGPVERGLRESSLLLDQLDSVLAEEFFQQVGPLVYLPSENPVLRRREGYRDIYRAWVLFEVAAKLAWDGGDDVFGAGQRNVATLYEFWVFLQLARIVSDLVRGSFDPTELISVDPSGLRLALKQGNGIRVCGYVTINDRRIDLELWFNRTFGKSGSWTRPLRPDVSLRISVQGDPVFAETWLHFDAKYRIESLLEVLGPDPQAGSEEQRFGAEMEREAHPTRAKQEDLLKMHAYRDAIHRSSGAYVVYPGEDNQSFQEFREILPGLGAFGLRPSRNGTAIGRNLIHAFITDVVQHSASQLTQDERLRFWVRETTSGLSLPTKATRVAAFLRRPAADTPVLLGYVRDEQHWAWIQRSRLYNLRAGERTGAVDVTSRELACEVLLLYSKGRFEPELWRIEGQPSLTTGPQMRRLGYEPRGDIYFCLPLGGRIAYASEFRIGMSALAAFIDRHRGKRPFGAPLATNWSTLLSET
jgi:predicted component of viral defense system (DUF524 family)